MTTRLAPLRLIEINVAGDDVQESRRGSGVQIGIELHLESPLVTPASSLPFFLAVDDHSQKSLSSHEFVDQILRRIERQFGIHQFPLVLQFVK
jgi:hypothetical protein